MAKTGDGESLGTAEGAVLGRATHTLHTDDPVLDDTWAVDLLGAASQAQARDPEHEARARAQSGFDFRPILGVGIGSLRYAEDEVERCVEKGFEQYVVLGAGFDTFALRREDMKDRLRVYEVDFPDVQALKRDRIEAAGRKPAQLPRFVSVDFETMRASEGLASTDFDPKTPSVWSWMNTIPYISEEGIEATLEDISGAMAEGSRLVLNYAGDVPLTTEQIEYLGTLGSVVSEGGEPMKSRFAPEAFEALLECSGFRILEHATENDLNDRYYRDRNDGLRAGMPARLVTSERIG